MSAAAEKANVGDFTIAEFSEQGRDNIGVLAASFNHMRRMPATSEETHRYLSLDPSGVT